MEQPWRYRCPNGHSSWRHRGGRLHCKMCNERFDQEDLVDVTSEETVAVKFAEGDSY